MLRSVQIERYSLLAGASVEFAAGFNAISGETGAGKTLLLDAIDFALGARTGSQVFPESGERLCVAVEFELPDGARIDGGAAMLRKGVHKIERLARQGGAARITLDGEKISAQAARTIAAALLDYSGQTENRALLNPKSHTSILDAFGGDAHKKALGAFLSEREKHSALLRQLEIIDRGEAARTARLKLLEAEIAELSAADVRPGEQGELAAKRSMLANAGRIAEQAERITNAIAGGEENTGGARRELETCREAAMQLAKLLGEESGAGEQFALLADDLAAMDAGIGEVESAAAALAAAVENDPAALEEVQSRLAEIDRLALKYGCGADGLAAELDVRRQESGELTGGEMSRDKVVSEIEAAAKDCDKHARALSKERAKAAKTLERRVIDYLKKLDFAGTRFEVAGLMDAAPLADEDSAEGLNSASWVLKKFREEGYDDVEFLVSLNPGEPARPLARVASGGEMSRLMLAITAAFAEHTSTPVLMFDEIEAGVGGLTSQAVADVMAEISKVRQVIAVTHLAQVAGRADCHFVVTKTARAAGGKSEIKIERVKGEERRAELARMLGTGDASKAKKMVDEILSR